MALRPHRTASYKYGVWCCALLVPAIVALGCSATGPKGPQPKSIDELYRDAVQSARSIPDSPRATRVAQQHRRGESKTGAPADTDRVQSVRHPNESNQDPPDAFHLPVSFTRLPPTWDGGAPSRGGENGHDRHAEPAIELVQRLEMVPLPEAKRVSDIFEETDIRQAIVSLASQAEVDVLIDDQVAGSCNAVIEDESFPKALEKLLLPLGLVSRFDGKRFLIGVADPESSLFPLIAEQIDYEPLHLSPADLKELLPERLSRFVRIVEKRNLVIIEAPGETAKRIAARLRELDEPVPQVELEAIICVVSPESGFRFGLDWGHTLKLGGDDVLNLGMSALSGSTALSPYGVRNAFDDFAVTSAFVRLLAQEGYLTIRAAPRVMAKDGEKASISIARETFFAVQPANANALFRQDIQKVEAGIGLEIIPIVRGDKITVMIEKAEVSEDIRTANGNSDISNNPYPLINRRTVTTTVDVKDGETIVIGGLMQQQKVEQVVRVPYLSRVPLFGKMFQTVENRDQEAEVAVFISPRIVNPHTSAPSREVLELYHEIE